MSGEIILDLSRLISRGDRSTPTGIDRVEFAYARHLLDTAQPRLRFAAMNPVGRVGVLPKAPAARYIEALERVWTQGVGPRGPDLKAMARALSLDALADGGMGLARRVKARGRPTYLLVSHHHLDKPAAIRRALKAAAHARFVTLVHDLIPIELPEYNRPGQDLKHALRMTAAAELSDAIIVNSQETGQALHPFLAHAKRRSQVVVAPLGVHAAAPQASGAREAFAADGPYFVCISTLEPRKNHLLLFNIWRRAAAEMGFSTPHLHLVGHRGWHNEAAIDVLERSTSLRPHLSEHTQLSDAQMASLLAGARALLMPSFAEGYGLPVAEALRAGVPVICSDLSTLRTVGGGAPEYLDPLDGPAWLQALRDYAAPRSPRREAQLARIARWSPPTWEAHFALTEPYLSDRG